MGMDEFDAVLVLVGVVFSGVSIYRFLRYYPHSSEK
jgi:hypothetical protein